MSAPPPVAPPTMPTMVSRLPKFSSRLPTATPAARLTNGFYHHPAPPAKQNGFLRAPTAFSLKFKADSNGAENVGRAAQPLPSAAKGRGSPTTTAPRTPPPSSKTRLSKTGPTQLKRPESSTQKKNPANRSHSSESLGAPKPARLTESDRFRSRSLTQVRSQPSPPLRNAAQKTSAAAPKSSPLAKPVCGRGSGRPPPTALKKPLLPVSSKPPGYRLSRPSLAKQPRPLRAAAPTRRRDSVETPSSTDISPESTPAAAPENGGSILGETLEVMSLSSTSQEFIDDFDNLGNGGMLLLKNEEEDSGLDPSSTRFDDVKARGVIKANGLCFVDDGMDWTAGERRPPHQRRSSQTDFHEQGGSSLDLSPSDSCGSGGTYMWDEEGLETLGGVATTASIPNNSSTSHHIGSFDSDVNSIDLLNNLDSDLAEDDLMLDVDFPEDSSLHSDSDGVARMAQWRGRQLCWGTQDNDNKRSPGSLSLGADVEELAEDCAAVRSQLEHLQSLLLQEEDLDEDTLTTETLSPETESSSQSTDVQVLLQEIQQLREELRSRDRTIAQLTLQLSVPTVEKTERTDQHTQTNVRQSESVALQTPWRENPAFPPLPFLSPPWQYQRSRPFRARPKPSIPAHLARKRVEHLVFYFSDTACHRFFTPVVRTTRTQ